VDRFFFSFVTIHAFDRRTDKILIARPHLHSMQRGKNVAIATHCNLRVPNAASVLIRFNYATFEVYC